MLDIVVLLELRSDRAFGFFGAHGPVGSFAGSKA